MGSPLPSRTERTRTCDVIGFHASTVWQQCISISRTDFPTLLTHTETFCLSIWRYALVWIVCWAKVRVKSEKDELCCLRTTHLDVANVFSAWIWRERIIFYPFRRTFYMLCYIFLPLTQINQFLLMLIIYKKSLIKVFVYHVI